VLAQVDHVDPADPKALEPVRDEVDAEDLMAAVVSV
jgi:hypothetical protein